MPLRFAKLVRIDGHRPADVVAAGICLAMLQPLVDFHVAKKYCGIRVYAKLRVMRGAACAELSADLHMDTVVGRIDLFGSDVAQDFDAFRLQHTSIQTAVSKP